MIKKRLHDEAGAEVLELVLAIPLLLICFLVAAQIIIWGFSSAQLASAAEATANQIDVVDIEDAGTNSAKAKKIIARDIASRMINVEASDLKISEVSIIPASTTIQKTQSGSSSNSEAISYRCVQSTGLLSFKVTYSCPQLIQVGSPLVLTHTWQRNRLISRIAEVY